MPACRQFFHIVGKLRLRALEEPGILHHDQTALREKGHGLRQIDKLRPVDPLAFIIGIVHGIPFRQHGPGQPVLILFLQIIFLSIKKIYLLKLSCF